MRDPIHIVQAKDCLLWKRIRKTIPYNLREKAYAHIQQSEQKHSRHVTNRINNIDTEIRKEKQQMINQQLGKEFFASFFVVVKERDIRNKTTEEHDRLDAKCVVCSFHSHQI